MINPTDLTVPTLGHCMVESPIQRYWAHANEMEIFVSDEHKILLDNSLTSVVASIARDESALAAFELAQVSQFRSKNEKMKDFCL